MHRVTQRERVIHTSVYLQEVNKAKLGNNIANHMGFIFALALYDKFGLTFKQITNYYTKTVNKRVAWQDDDICPMRLSGRHLSRMNIGTLLQERR